MGQNHGCHWELIPRSVNMDRKTSEEEEDEANGGDWEVAEELIGAVVERLKLQESIRAVKEDMLPPEHALVNVIQETEEKVAKADCKLTHFKVRKDGDLMTTEERHEIRYWEGVKELYMCRMNLFEKMRAVQKCMLELPTNLDDTTREDRLMFAALGETYLELGNDAFKSTILRVLQNNQVVIERDPDEDYWLSGVALTNSKRASQCIGEFYQREWLQKRASQYIVEPDEREWLQKLHAKPPQVSVLKWRTRREPVGKQKKRTTNKTTSQKRFLRWVMSGGVNGHINGHHSKKKDGKAQFRRP